MDEIKVIKVMLITSGLAVIFGFLISFFQSGSPLDLLWVTVGLFTVISGYYVENRKVKESVSFLIAIFGVNVLQWIILIYIFFMNQFYIMIDFYFFLVAASLLTITLIVQIYQSPSNPLKINKKAEYKFISNVRMIMDKKQIFLIILGILIILGCLVNLFQTKSLYALFYSSLGIMMIIYGYHLKINKTQMSLNYFGMMLSVYLFQWMLIFYIVGYVQPLDSGEISIPVTIVILISIQFYIQIRESNMKYLGRYKEKN